VDRSTVNWADSFLMTQDRLGGRSLGSHLTPPHGAHLMAIWPESIARRARGVVVCPRRAARVIDRRGFLKSIDLALDRLVLGEGGCNLQGVDLLDDRAVQFLGSSC